MPPVTDSFTGTTGTALPTYSANWSTLASGVLNNMSIGTNNVRGNNNSGNYYSGRVWANDHYSQAVVVALPDQHWGVAVRCSAGSTREYYGAGIQPGTQGHNRYVIWKYVGDTFTNLITHGSQTMSVSDVVKLEVSGSTLTLYVNSVQVLQTTDSSIASGSAGIAGFGITGNPLEMLDTWEGDDLGGGGGPVGDVEDLLGQMCGF